MESLDHLVEIMISGDDDEIDGYILTESEKDDVVKSLDGDTTILNYMMLFETLLEEYNLYLFDGWENAEFTSEIGIEKFWVSFTLLVPKGTDIRGLKRLKSAMGQGEIKGKKLSDGRYKIRITVLKRELDRIEKDNQERIEQLADETAEMT